MPVVVPTAGTADADEVAQDERGRGPARPGGRRAARRRVLRLLALLMASVLLAAGLLTRERPEPSPRTPVADRVLPAAGSGALFGYYQQRMADVRPVETQLGRRVDVVHRYYDFDATGPQFPTPADDELSAEGRTLHIGWDGVSYDGGYEPSVQPAPAAAAETADGEPRRVWTYRQILDGSLDRYLDRVAERVAASPYDYIFDFQHEMDDLPDLGGTNRIAAAAGSRAEWAAAHRYIVDRFRARGVANVVWAWTVSGWAVDDRSTWAGYQELWPGQGYVDLVLWDPYNRDPGRWRSPSEIIAPFYDAVRAGLLDPVDRTAARLPLGLAEYGVVDDPRREAWLRSVPEALEDRPQIVYANYFSSGSWAALHDDPRAVDALREAAGHPWMQTRAG